MLLKLSQLVKIGDNKRKQGFKKEVLEGLGLDDIREALISFNIPQELTERTEQTGQTGQDRTGL